MMYCRKNNIQQIHISNILKGHNYKHPKKYFNVKYNRENETYKYYAKQSEKIVYGREL